MYRQQKETLETCQSLMIYTWVKSKRQIYTTTAKFVPIKPYYGSILGCQYRFQGFLATYIEILSPVHASMYTDTAYDKKRCKVW